MELRATCEQSARCQQSQWFRASVDNAEIPAGAEDGAIGSRLCAGNTGQFYKWLEASSVAASIPHGPASLDLRRLPSGQSWPAGGCRRHHVQIQIRDLDQTVIGNPALDLIRLGFITLESAARSSDLPGVTTAKMVEALIDGYVRALRSQDDLRDMPKTIGLVMRESARRTWKHLAKERIRDAKPTIPIGKKFFAISDQERSRIERLFETEALRKLVTKFKSRESDCAIKIADAAFWMKGCSSLGLLRYAVLVKVGSGKSADYALMDIKEAVAASAPRYRNARMPRSNGRAGRRRRAASLAQSG